MSKRGNGEGSLYQRESDGKWVGAVVVDGRRRTVYGDTQHEARDNLRRVQRAVEDGLPVTPGRGTTVAGYLAQWTSVTLPSRVRSGRLKPSTFDSYRDVVERHIVPTLGKEPLAKLTPAKVRAWLSAKQIEPSGRQPKPRADAELALVLLSARTVGYFHAVLRKALADAVRTSSSAGTSRRSSSRRSCGGTRCSRSVPMRRARCSRRPPTTACGLCGSSCSPSAYGVVRPSRCAGMISTSTPAR